jgi:hypothetical protein
MFSSFNLANLTAFLALLDSYGNPTTPPQDLSTYKERLVILEKIEQARTHPDFDQIYGLWECQFTEESPEEAVAVFNHEILTIRCKFKTQKNQLSINKGTDMEPIKAGDLCVVVNALSRKKSPNLGLIVTVGKRIYGDHGMDHTTYGPIVEIVHPDLMQLGDNGEYVKMGWAHIPTAWLQKIDPPKLIESINKVLEAEQ